MSKRLTKRVHPHLRPDEALTVVGESGREDDAVGAALSGGIGPLGNLYRSTRQTQTAHRIDGAIALTNLRLLAVDSRGPIGHLDRASIESIEVFDSKASPGMRRTVIAASDQTWELHMSVKQTTELTNCLSTFDGTAITETKDDPLALLKAIPVIFGFLIGGLVTLIAVPQTDVVPAAIGLSLVFAAEALRRRWFRQRTAKPPESVRA